MNIEPLPTRRIQADEWDALPPLVPKGANKDEVLTSIIDQWCSSSPVDSPFSFVHEHLNAGGFVLRDVSLVDANASPPEPIDLGDLIRRLRDTVVSQGHDKHRRMHVVLIGCRIDACYLSGLSFTDHPFRPTFRIHNCRITCFANFSRTVFGDDSGITNTAFEKGASFEGIEFSCRPDFSDTTFEGDVDFSKATLVVDAKFDRTKFHGNARFWMTDFGRDPSFSGMQLSADTDFLDVRFAPHNGFGGLTVACEHFNKWPISIRTLIAKLRDRFGWQFVRGIGGLQMLTRVSYGAIVLVPIIAGLWPRNLPFVNIDAPRMPIEWPLAYFAAILVVVGHLLYETGAPELVKRMSIDDFVSHCAEKFRSSKESEQPDLIQRSFSWLSTAAISLPATRHPNFVKRHGTAIWIPRDPQELLQFSDEYKRLDITAEKAKFYLDRRLPTHTPDELLLIIVDEGAKAEYIVTARQSIASALCSSMCYVAGGYLILWLISKQATTILTAAGLQGPWLPNLWAECGLLALIVVLAIMALLIVRIVVRNITKAAR